MRVPPANQYILHSVLLRWYLSLLLAEEPEKLAGPLLADTYVTLLKGRNAWYGQQLAKGGLSLEMGDSIKGMGMIQVWTFLFQGVSNLNKQFLVGLARVESILVLLKSNHMIQWCFKFLSIVVSRIEMIWCPLNIMCGQPMLHNRKKKIVFLKQLPGNFGQDESFD